MFFSGGLIPLYLVVKSLGLINLRAALLLPNALAVWNVIIARTFFQHSIPCQNQPHAGRPGTDQICQHA